MTNCLNRGDNTFVMLKWAEFNHKKMPCKCDLSLAVRLKYAAHISSFLWLCFSKEKKRTAKYLCMKMWLLMQKKAPGWPDRQCSELDMDGIDRSDERPIPTCPLSGPWLIYNPPPPLIPTSPPHTASLLPAPPPLSLYPCHSPLAPPRHLMQSVTNPECFFPPIQTQRQARVLLLREEFWRKVWEGGGWQQRRGRVCILDVPILTWPPWGYTHDKHQISLTKTAVPQRRSWHGWGGMGGISAQQRPPMGNSGTVWEWRRDKGTGYSWGRSNLSNTPSWHENTDGQKSAGFWLLFWDEGWCECLGGRGGKTACVLEARRGGTWKEKITTVYSDHVMACSSHLWWVLPSVF